MIRTLDQGVDCLNSLCGNYPRLTWFYDEKKDKNCWINGGVCRLFLKDQTGKYTIPTPFFGFWSGYSAGSYVCETKTGLVNEEYYKLAIAGDCIHNFVIASYDKNGTFKTEFCKIIDASYDYCYECGSNKMFDVKFDGEPIYPDVVFSDFIYSIIFNFGKDGWSRFFEIVGKYVFLSSPMWEILEQNGEFGNRFWKEFVYVEDVVKRLIMTFKMGGIVLYDSKEFGRAFESMCDACLLCKCPDESLDELGKWLVSKGYQLNKIEKLYCQVEDFGDNGEIRFEHGFGYDFVEIAFALLRRE